MAKYLSTTTTTISGKLGGVVFGNGSVVRTIRSKAYPTHPSGSGTPVTTLQLTSALQAWLTMTGSNNIAWSEFAAWVGYLQGKNPYRLLYNTFAIFSAAWGYGIFLNQAPVPGPVATPAAPPNPLAATLTLIAGVLTATALQSGGYYTGSWLLSAQLNTVGPNATPPTSGYTLIAGSDSTYSNDCTATFITAFGQLPSPGDTLFIRLDTLWPGKLYVYGSQYFVIPVSA